jgi:hypothetical protein
MINPIILIFYLPSTFFIALLWQYHYGNSPSNALFISKVPADGHQADTGIRNIHTLYQVVCCIKHVLLYRYIEGRDCVPTVQKSRMMDTGFYSLSTR